MLKKHTHAACMNTHTHTHTHTQCSLIFTCWHEVLFNPLFVFFSLSIFLSLWGLLWRQPASSSSSITRFCVGYCLCCCCSAVGSHNAVLPELTSSIMWVMTESIWKPTATQSWLSHHRCRKDVISLLHPLSYFIAVLKWLWILQNVALLWESDSCTWLNEFIWLIIFAYNFMLLPCWPQFLFILGGERRWLNIQDSVQVYVWALLND